LTLTVSGTVTDAQLEIGALTAYQRVGASSRSDVSEAGQPQVYFVSPDGTTNFMVSAANVDFSATDRMFVCAGVTKKSDATRANIYEMADGTITNSKVFLSAPSANGSTNYTYNSNGSSLATATATPYVAPITNVLSGVSRISTDSCLIRTNGVEAGTSATDQGTGNYGNYLTYVGARAGTSLFSSANIYQLIAVGKTPTTPELSATENFVAQKTKGSLA
jgi:hypothetical protein